MADAGRGADELSVDLAPSADAPGLARDFVADACRRWGTPWWEIPAVLVASELVTNAVRHVGAPFVLRLSRESSGLVLMVEDTGGGRPRVVPVGQRNDGGRGLAIVERLADAWGVAPTTEGKAVWARFGTPR